MAEGKEIALDEMLNSALNLMRRMPPSSTENSLAGLLELAPDLTDDLLTHVDQPLKVENDTSCENKPFVLCDYNRDGDSYRSPWSNEYFPALVHEGFKPNKRLRAMEIEANQLLAIYLKLYFAKGGYSSAYFFETDYEEKSDGFGACFLIKKDVSKQGNLTKAVWDSIHVFEVIAVEGSTGKPKFTYKLTTTVMIALNLTDCNIGTADLSGLRTQQHENTTVAESDSEHIKNMGKMLEDCETRIRTELENIYIQKTRTVISGMRGGNQKLQAQWGNIAESLNKAKFHNKRK